MKPLMAGDINTLEKLSQLIDDFPTGKDDFIQRYWITNAIDCGNLEGVRWMLEKKASVIFRDDEGYTVLHSAIDREKPDKYEMMQVLIDAGADVNAHGINDWTPAHMAAARNDVQALKLLHEAGADFTIRTRIDIYATPLEEAINLGHSPEAVAYLKSSTEQDGAGNAASRHA
ncbi:MAG: ankyrin repeat domain-containing protein [Limisphaerales bacterium]